MAPNYIIVFVFYIFSTTNALNITSVELCGNNCNPAAKTDCILNSSYSLSCPTSITIIDVMYGRQDRTTCLLYGKSCGLTCSTSCNSSLAYNYVFEYCQGKTKCEIDLLEMAVLKSESCGQTVKYGIVKYSCNDHEKKDKINYKALIIIALMLSFLFTMMLTMWLFKYTTQYCNQMTSHV